jgi:predicted alpha/beta hydrolase family esterase
MPTTKSRSGPRRNIEQATGAHVLFVQGGGKGAHDSWDNKLVASLERALGPDYTVRYPRMPDEDNPKPLPWKKAIAREVGQLGDGVILVGHSIGAAILMDYLADGTVKPRPSGIFLIAVPFIGAGGWPSDDLRPTTEVAVATRGDAPLYLYQGRDDETVPASHVERFATAFPDAVVRRLDGRDHQLNDDLSEVARDIKLLA